MPTELIQFIKDFGGTATAKRATALQPVIWVLVASLVAPVVASNYSGANWLTLVFAGIAVFVALVFVGAFIYLLVVDRDALRSERFALRKMRIERGVSGDSDLGVSGSRRTMEQRTKQLEGMDQVE